MITTVEFTITAEQLLSIINEICGIDPQATASIEGEVMNADGEVVTGEFGSITVVVRTDLAGAQKIERKRKAKGLAE